LAPPAGRSLHITAWFVLPVVLLLLNVWIAGKLFGVEYSAVLQSNEGTFIAIARQIAAHHLGDLLWWPFWDCGLPFQNTYLPLLHLLVGFFSQITGHSPALAFHQVSAVFFCLAPTTAYLMALGMTRKPEASFFGALAYTVFSPCALLIPGIRADLGGVLNLRRLNILAYYGEGPHTAALAFIPLAIVFLYLAMTSGRLWQKMLAGVCISAAVLSNAFAAVILALALMALLASYATDRFWRNAVLFVVIGGLAYGWICPLLPPSVISAIRTNSPTVDGDYAFTARSEAGVAILAAGFLMLWFFAHRFIRSRHVGFFLLFAWLTTGIVALGSWRVNVVPQPIRYQIAMDLSLCMLVVFGAAEWLVRAGRRTRIAIGAVVLLAIAIQSRHAIRYARHLIRSTDITQTSPYRIAQWADANMAGARVMISGVDSFYFNDFTDTPQLHGGHDPMQPNPLLRIVPFTLYTGMNTGAQDGSISILWLKALGAHAISVPGPDSPDYNKPFVNPTKFDGLLPVLWKQGFETIYAVPARSNSLAHVLSPGALVHHLPINGLDTTEAQRYVDALNSPDGGDAFWRWNTWHSATIHAVVPAGQVISTQVTFRPGWHASVGGSPQQVYADGLGFLVVKPDCQGSCDFTLWYDGGPEWRVTSMISIATMLLVLLLALRSLWRRFALTRPEAR
jgi:hypothetical protein